MSNKKSPTGQGGTGSNAGGVCAQSHHSIATTGTQQVILGPAVSTTAGPAQVFTTPTATATPIYTAGRRCGAVVGDCWRKTIHGEKHILRYPKPSIAFSVESVGQAKAAGAGRVDVFDDIGGVHYCATLARIEQFGFEVHRAGFEKQVALPLVFFIRQVRAGGTQPEPPDPVAYTLDLFGGLQL